MVLLDASALIAFLVRDPAADSVARMLREDQPAIPSINLAEVVDVLGRRAPDGYAEARRAIEPLIAEVIEVRPLSEQVAWNAARIRIAHYHRKDSPLSMADCVLLATAETDDTIVSTDIEVIAAAKAEGLVAANPRGR